MFEDKEEKYRVTFVYYVKAESGKEAIAKVQKFRSLDNADEENVTKLRKQ
jgi:hypothetical protein